MPNAYEPGSSCSLKPQAATAHAFTRSRRQLLLAGVGLAGAGLVSTGAGAQPLPKAGPGRYTELRWADLVPNGWDPTKDMRDVNAGQNPRLFAGEVAELSLRRRVDSCALPVPENSHGHRAGQDWCSLFQTRYEPGAP